MEKYLSERYQKIILRLIALVVLSSTFARLFFGVEFTDESQYVAQIVGPLIGGEAFLTDRLFQQSGSLLATPFAFIYLQLVGSTTGIVLFLRLLFFATSTLTALVLFKTLSKRISSEAALAIGSLSVAYIPFIIPNVSYNTMAVLLTTMSLALARLLVENKRKLIACCLAATVALGIFSYPPLFIAYLLLFLFYFRNKVVRPLLWYAAGWSLLFMAALAWPVFRIGLTELKQNLSIAQSVSLLTFTDKIKISINYLNLLAPSWVFAGATLLVCITLSLFKKSYELAALPILSVFYIFVADHSTVDMNPGFVIYGTILVLIFTTIHKIQNHEKPIVNIEVSVALVAGIIMGTTSGNGMLNAALGFSIALLFIFESFIVKNLRFPWLAWISAVSIFCCAQWTFFYREGQLATLNHQVESGPYFGLLTSQTKGDFLLQIEADLNSLPKNANSILSYDSFPAGYLFKTIRPLTFMYYMHPASMTPSIRPFLTQMFSMDSNLPDVVLEMTAVPVTENSVFFIKDPNKNIYNDPFWNFIKNNRNYRQFIQRQHYTIYVKNYL